MFIKPPSAQLGLRVGLLPSRPTQVVYFVTIVTETAQASYTISLTFQVFQMGDHPVMRNAI